MTVASLKSRLARMSAQGRKLDAADVRKLVGAARDGGKVDAKELKLLADLPADRFQPGAREDLQTLLGATSSKAYVNVARANAPALELDRASASGVPGMQLTLESGAGQLTANTFWLEGKATAAGTLSLNIDGKAINVAARKGESSASLSARLAKQMPPGYSLWANPGFAGRTQLQVFRMNPVPPSLVKPVLDGKAPPVKVLITGYGKFANFTTDDANPAWQLAKKMAQEKFPGAVIEAVCLPVEWSKVDAFAKRVSEEMKPDVVISLGAGPHGLEVWAQNATEGDDAAGLYPSQPKANANGPDMLLGTLPAQRIEAAIGRIEDASKGGSLGLHASPEGTFDERLDRAKQYQLDAQNTYLCNYLNYRLAEQLRGTGTMSGFVHVDETTSPQELMTVVQESVLAQLEKRTVDLPRS